MKQFIRAYELGEVFWPRNFKGRQKETMSIPEPIRARIEENSQNRWNATIYVARSNFFVRIPSIIHTPNLSVWVCLLHYGLLKANELQHLMGKLLMK